MTSVRRRVPRIEYYGHSLQLTRSKVFTSSSRSGRFHGCSASPPTVGSSRSPSGIRVVIRSSSLSPTRRSAETRTRMRSGSARASDRPGRGDLRGRRAGAASARAGSVGRFGDRPRAPRPTDSRQDGRGRTLALSEEDRRLNPGDRARVPPISWEAKPPQTFARVVQKERASGPRPTGSLPDVRPGGMDEGEPPSRHGSNL